MHHKPQPIISRNWLSLRSSGITTFSSYIIFKLNYNLWVLFYCSSVSKITIVNHVAEFVGNIHYYCYYIYCNLLMLMCINSFLILKILFRWGLFIVEEWHCRYKINCKKNSIQIQKSCLLCNSVYWKLVLLQNCFTTTFQFPCNLMCETHFFYF